MTKENVKVAVRVRPFNKREETRHAKCIIAMHGNETIITNPDSEMEQKKFAFDHSYWSFDGYKEDENGYLVANPAHWNADKYCDQKKMYDELGKGILHNAWEGYNSTLFAYGQTGSGKSWSVIGYESNPGIVPQFCSDIFGGIKEKEIEKSAEFEVKFSMLEIYNEVARDLLSPTKKSKKGLKIRQHPKKGFYAEGLKSYLVTNYDEIEQRMNEGTINRTVASTNMNATSSRAHTIVGITFSQRSKNVQGQETAKTATVNLVDLAGSERVEQAGSKGERLKEGAAINQSLSCLGNCIHALAERAQGRNIRVPYRDSVLTKLLMHALGGNSRTVMIAAVSPADVNYDESLSTLRYADRAKQIKTQAMVNEDPTEKLIRELTLENERLKKALVSGEVDMGLLKEIGGKERLSIHEIEELKKRLPEELQARMHENEKEIEEIQLSHEEKVMIAKMEQGQEQDSNLKIIEELKKTKPHIFNLNFDPLLSGRLVHILNSGDTEVGNRKGNESDITMVGPGMQEKHAVFTYNEADQTVHLKPFTRDCRVLVNGGAIQGETELLHNDRLVFGGTQIWVFQNPNEEKIDKKHYPPITFDFAQEEIASKSGVYMAAANTSTAVNQDDLLEVMPAVEEANSISEELDKRVKFEIVVVAPQILGKNHGNSEICVKMKNLENGLEFLWSKEKFLSRLYQMKEIYSKYEEDDDWHVSEEEDPFQESVNTEVIIGSVQVFLQPLAYMVEMREQLQITNLKGQEVGIMNIEVLPCDANGRVFSESEERFVDAPEQLVGRDVHFLFKIISCRGLPNKYYDIYCKYRIYLDEDDTLTENVGRSVNPDFNHVKKFTFTLATQQFVEYLNHASVLVQLMGKQFVRKSAIPNPQGLTTREMLKEDRSIFSKTANLMNGFQLNGRSVDPQKQGVIVELLLMKKSQARLQQKIDAVKKLLERADYMGKERIPTSFVKSVLNSSSAEHAEKIIALLEGK